MHFHTSSKFLSLGIRFGQHPLSLSLPLCIGLTRFLSITLDRPLILLASLVISHTLVFISMGTSVHLFHTCTLSLFITIPFSFFQYLSTYLTSLSHTHFLLLDTQRYLNTKNNNRATFLSPLQTLPNTHFSHTHLNTQKNGIQHLLSLSLSLSNTRRQRNTH